MSKEAMKLALEALERMKRYGNTFGYRSHEQNPYEQVCEAITALREALAEQPAPVQQAPSFYRHEEDGHLMKPERAKFLGFDLNDLQALYTFPPAQRPWVGLTEEEKRQLFDREDYQGWLDYINAIEAKLREKNQ